MPPWHDQPPPREDDRGRSPPTSARGLPYAALRARILRALDLTLGRARPADAGEQRHASVGRAALSALVGRAVGILVALASVPLSVGYLGAERYGAWVAIVTGLAWLALADLGIANGLTTAVAEAQGAHRPEVARAHVASAMWLLTGIAFAVLAFGGWGGSLVDWARVFNLHTAAARAEIRPALAIAFALFLFSLPLTIVDRVFAARQEGVLANAWAAAGHVASLAGVVIATRVEGGMIALVVGVSGSRFVVQLASAAWLFGRHAPELRPRLSGVTRSSAARLTATGGLYFLIQAAALVLYNTDNLIIARVLGAERVTPYSVMWSLFTIPTMLIVLAFPYLWPAYTDAMVRGDAVWVRRTFRAATAISGAVSILTTIPLVAFGDVIAVAWAGPAAAAPASLRYWMGAWAIIIAPTQSIACLLNAAGRLRTQVVYGVTAAVTNVALSIVLARTHGITGVIAATVLSWLACGAVPSAIEVARVLARLPAAKRRDP